MNNRPHEEILREYDRAERLSKKDIDSVPASTRPGFEISIRKAKDALPGLRAEYNGRIMKNAVGLFLQGEKDDVAKFVEAAVAEGAVHLNAAEIFEKIANIIQPSLGGKREFSVTQVGLLDNALRDLCEKAGHRALLNRTSVNSLKVIADRERLVSYVRQLVFENNGSVPSVVAAQASITASALKMQFKDKRLVVVITGIGSEDRGPIGSLFSLATNLAVDPGPDQVVDARFARDKVMGVLKPTTARVPTKAPEVTPSEQPKTETTQEQS